MKTMETSSRGLMKSPISKPTLWVVGAILFSLLICVSMAWLHLMQRRALSRAIIRLDNLGTARLDMSRGLLHISLAGPPGSPFQREQGLALMNQAVSTLTRAIDDLGPDHEALSRGFSESIKRFQDQLSIWNQTRPPGSSEEVLLRIAFHELERYADRVDMAIRQGLNALSRRLDKEFKLALGIAVLFLGSVCGLVFVVGRGRERFETALRESEESHRVTLMSVGDGVIATDAESRVRLMNPVAEGLTGWKLEEALGRPLDEIFRIVNEETGLPVEDPVGKIIRSGLVVGLANHTLLIDRNGAEHPVADSGAPIHDERGLISGVVLVFRDQSDERAAMRALSESETIHRTLVNHLPQRIFIKNRDSVYTSCNAAYARDLDISPEEIRGRDDFAFYSEALAGKYREDDRTVMDSDTPKDMEEQYTVNGVEHLIHTIKVPYHDADGTVIGVLGIFEEITERKRMEEALRKSEGVLRVFVEHAPAAIAMLDNNMRYLSVSRRWQTDFRLSSESIIGRSHYEVFPETPERWKEIHRRCLQGATEKCDEDLVSRQDGAVEWIKWEIRPWYQATGLVGGIIIMSENITGRKHAEAALKESESRFRHLFHVTPLPLCYARKDGEIVDLNARFVQTFGYEREELENMTQWWLRAFPDEACRLQAVGTWEAAVKRAERDRQDIESIEYRITCKDGKERTVIMSGITLDEDILATFVDITDRKIAEEALKDSEAKFRLAFLTSPDAINLNRLDDGLYLDINDGFTNIMGYTREDAVGKNSLELNIWENPADRIRLVRGLRERGFVQNLEAPFRDKSGSIHIGLMSARVLRLQGAEVILSVTRDITERKRDETALRNSLQEKVALLKEVHHRVKNNLQIVASLLSLQANRSKVPHVVEVLQDTRNRVRSMALLHERLYRSGNLAHIHFPSYVDELCLQLLRSCGPAGARIKTETRVAPVSLPLEQAVPCGLIISELVANAFKHGFPDDRPGKVCVSFQANEDNHLILSVIDNGIGLPVDFDSNEKSTLGLQLVSNLANQLGGSLTVGPPDEGGAFCVVFPAPKGTQFGGEA